MEWSGRAVGIGPYRAADAARNHRRGDRVADPAFMSRFLERSQPASMLVSLRFPFVQVHSLNFLGPKAAS
jgi:hypothetical protein